MAIREEIINSTYAQGELKCFRCSECRGLGCPGNLPGLGGVFNNKNFQLNCAAWKELRELDNKKNLSKILEIPIDNSKIACGPVTGAVENIGYQKEEDFYSTYLEAAAIAHIGLCLGDGFPDQKLKLGIEAVKNLSEKYDFIKPAFFLKPYPTEILLERLVWLKDYAYSIGIDIDSYNILTMRNKAKLEKKTKENLLDFKKNLTVPFIIKGVFRKEDIELVKEVRPDVVYVSNHGGRVETDIGSSGGFLYENAQELKKYCAEIWVDGGIRNKEDVQTAIFYGADKVIIARPFIRQVFDHGLIGIKKYIEENILK